MAEQDITTAERTILRELARRVAEIAALPEMAARRRRWKLHNELKSTYPILWVSPEGSWRELLPENDLRCGGKGARAIERTLRMQIYAFEHFHDDAVLERRWIVGKAVRNSGWGLQAQWDYSREETGARKFHPVILDEGDLKKLRFPEVTHDEQASQRSLQRAQELFGDILDVQLKGVRHVSFHLMSIYTSLRGLQEVMIDMIERPSMLHEAMAFLAEGHRRMIQQYVDLNLLSLNNDETYHSSGGKGYSEELPASGFDPARVRPCDLWASAESQELAQVSPAMHREFALRYEKPLLAPFGLNGYGCCEDLTAKLDDVLTIPNIRRISISPWADVDRCAEKLRGGCIFSWKPHPAHVCDPFEPEKIRAYIRHTLDVARASGCVLEMILKDTHTCNHQPRRFTTWTRIARELVGEMHD